MKTFAKAALVRAIKTICQTAVAMIGTSVVMSDVDWRMVASASILSGVLSVLTSIATGLPEVEYAEWQEQAYEDVIELTDEEDAEG